MSRRLGWMHGRVATISDSQRPIAVLTRSLALDLVNAGLRPGHSTTEVRSNTPSARSKQPNAVLIVITWVGDTPRAQCTCKLDMLYVAYTPTLTLHDRLLDDGIIADDSRREGVDDVPIEADHGAKRNEQQHL